MSTTSAPPTGDPGPPGPPSERARVRRLPDRARYDATSIEAILDEGLVAHVGIVTERGPVVIPTAYGRVGDTLYLHGSPASRLVRSLAGGIEVCVTVTLLDGLVLARSAFHHSMNYRSVVVFGTATEVRDLDEKRAALDALVEHIVPGRGAEVRPASDKELRGTSVLTVPLAEASAKVRTGPPIDDEEDLERPVWAGVVPFAPVPGPPWPDAHTPADRPVPGYVTGYARTVR